MWLRRLVGVMMIVVFAGLNTLVVVGLFQPQHTHTPTVSSGSSPATVNIDVPTVSMSVNPAAIQTGTTSGLSWTTTGSPDSCTASGSWSGDKTAYGAESTGRINAVGEYKYTLNCKNNAGSSEATAIVKVTSSPPPASAAQTTTGSSTGTAVQATYCKGRSPCYNKNDVAKHGSKGNCWGYNLDRVMDVSGFDAGYHITRTGISSMEVAGVCGTDLGPSLRGSITVENQNGSQHNASSRTNTDPNEAPYFVGYFDANKP